MNLALKMKVMIGRYGALSVTRTVPPALLVLADGHCIVIATVAGSIPTRNGRTEAANRLGNSVNTAKTHLRALFDKLDCSRQTDLISTVTSHPIWLAGRDP